MNEKNVRKLEKATMKRLSPRAKQHLLAKLKK